MATTDSDALVKLIEAHRPVFDPDDPATFNWCDTPACPPKDETFAAHLANVIEAHYAEKVAEAMARAWDEGWKAGIWQPLPIPDAGQNPYLKDGSDA